MGARSNPRILLLGVLLSGLFLATSGFALEPSFHFLISGNWRGSLASWTTPEFIHPTPLCGLPEFLDAASGRHPAPESRRGSRKRQARGHAAPDRPVRIFAGNAFAVTSPLSLLGRGACEDALIKACAFNIIALGPEDLLRLREKSALAGDLFTRLWTNVEYSLGVREFPDVTFVTNPHERIGVGCLISPDLLLASPIKVWAGYASEAPERTIRRVLARGKAVDSWLWIGHLTPEDVDRVLPLLTGRDRLLWVPPTEGTALADDIKRGVVPRAWCLENGAGKVLSIRSEIREGGKKVDRVHRLELDERSPSQVPEFLRAGFAAFRKALRQPLRVVNLAEVPLNEPFQIPPAMYARFAREFLRTDFALLGFAEVPYQQDRVISPEIIFRTTPADQLRAFTLTGRELRRLLETLFQSQIPLFFGLDGAARVPPDRVPPDRVPPDLKGDSRAAFLNHGLTEMSLRGGAVRDQDLYSLTLNERLFADPLVKPLLPPDAEAGKCGWTLWDSCLNELPKLPRHVKIGVVE